MDPDFFRMLMGGPPKRRPLDVQLNRALGELARLSQLVPAAMVAGPVLVDDVIAECERVCIAAAARFHEARTMLQVDPLTACTPVVIAPGDDE